MLPYKLRNCRLTGCGIAALQTGENARLRQIRGIDRTYPQTMQVLVTGGAGFIGRPAVCQPDRQAIQEQAGSLISKQQPPSVFTTRTLPRWASTTPRTIARPRPAPLSGLGLRASVPRQARSNT